MNTITAPITVIRAAITAPIEVGVTIIPAQMVAVGNSVTAPVSGSADAYQLALRDGFVGTRMQWGESLVGRSAYQSYLATTPADPLSESDWSAAGGATGGKGDKGDKGDMGEPGGLSPGYVHSQLSSVTIWSITHSLARHPSVTIVDSAGSVVIGDVNYLSANQLTVTFSAAFSGTAYLN